MHGHSYSAHALGCTAAAKSIKWFKNPQTNQNINSEGKSLREASAIIFLFCSQLTQYKVMLYFEGLAKILLLS